MTCSQCGATIIRLANGLCPECNRTAIPDTAGTRDDLAFETKESAVRERSDGQASSESQPQNQLVEALSAGAFAGAGAGFAAHYFAGGTLTFPIWIAAYVLVIANVKNKTVATVVFVAVAALVSVVLGELAPSHSE
jgi:hypothetical protein